MYCTLYQPLLSPSTVTLAPLGIDATTLLPAPAPLRIFRLLLLVETVPVWAVVGVLEGFWLPPEPDWPRPAKPARKPSAEGLPVEMLPELPEELPLEPPELPEEPPLEPPELPEEPPLEPPEEPLPDAALYKLAIAEAVLLSIPAAVKTLAGGTTPVLIACIAIS